MDKFVKLQSVEGGEITSSDNIRNFRIHAGDVYDLRDSFFQFNCEIERTEANTQGGDGVYTNMIEWVSDETAKPHFPNSAFVKNGQLKSDMKGNIESCRRIDIYRANIHLLTRSQREVADESYEAVNQLPQPINSQEKSIFTAMNKSGAVKSLESKNVPLAIPCSDIFDFCSTDEYDTNRGGGLHMRLELNRAKLQAVQVGTTPAPSPQVLRFTNVATSVGSGNKLVMGTGTTALRVLDLDQSPYYVGQKLLITATGTGTGGDKPADVAGQGAVIKSILYEKGNADQSLGGKITLTFEENWGVASLTGDGGYSNVSCTIATCTPTLKINSAELILKRKDPSDLNNYSQIEYTALSTEEGNGIGRSPFQDQFVVEGEATQAIMMFAQGSDDLISSAPLTSFRCSLNNEDITDRDVVVKSPLYYDRLAGTIRGSGYNLRNLVQNVGDSASSTYSATYTAETNQSLPLVASLFQTPSNKLLQVKAEAGTITYQAPTGAKSGVNSYQLYKHLPRVFAY